MAGRASVRQGLAVAASVAIHSVLTLGPSWAKAPSDLAKPQATEAEPPAPAESIPIGLELPLVAEGLSIEERPADIIGDPPPPPTGDAVAHPDTEAAGRGGDVASKEAALNMADEEDRMRRSPDLLSRLDRDQIQRLKAGRSRASWEDRRSTTHPAELTLVAIGSGSVPERRELAVTVPSRGPWPHPSRTFGEARLDPSGS